jgi:hypothetical protein
MTFLRAIMDHPFHRGQIQRLRCMAPAGWECCDEWREEGDD